MIKLGDITACSLKANFTDKNDYYRWLNIDPDKEKYKKIAEKIRKPLKKRQMTAFDGDNLYHNNLTQVMKSSIGVAKRSSLVEDRMQLVESTMIQSSQFNRGSLKPILAEKAVQKSNMRTTFTSSLGKREQSI